MPLSITNSKRGGYGKSWAVSLLIALILLAATEILFRVNGHLPSIVDDERLWAIERSEVHKGEGMIALLGSSRMLTDISIPTLRRLMPKYRVINLAVDGTCANATLLDLSEDISFKGIVVMETTSECLMFGNESGLSQRAYVDFYHRDYNLNIATNRIIATFLQKNIVSINPYLNLMKVFGDKIITKKWRKPNYITTNEDRSRSADYSKLDIENHKSKRLEKVTTHYRKLQPRISLQFFTEQVLKIDDAVQRIRGRGGEVFFVRFPVSDEHWEMDETFFPRRIYWDTLSWLTEASALHFKDVEGISNVRCPDTSHLDLRDTSRFTVHLFRKITEKIL